MRISLKSQVGLPCFVEEDLAFLAFVSSGLKIHVSLVRFRPEPQNPHRQTGILLNYKGALIIGLSTQ